MLWVGAGASCQADPPLPTLWRLACDLQTELWPESPPIADPYAFIDEYVTTFKARGGLARFLEAKLRPGGRSSRPGPLHAALARLIGAGKVSAVIDTNYDLVVRQALEQAGAAYLPSTLSGNLELPADAVPRYWALHGDHGDWLRTVLDGESYATYHQRHPLAIVQLELYLRQRPILFVGCSMQDPRIVDWLAALAPDARANLHGLVAVLDSRAKAELEAKAKLEPKYAILLERLLIAELASFADLPGWFEALAAELAPRARLREARAPVLVGREPERDQLRAGLVLGRRIAVLGPAGIGKTALVRTLLTDPDLPEISFVSLAGLDSADAITNAVASALGVGGQDLPATLAARLAARPTQLILDELEHAWHREPEAVEALLASWSTTLVVTLRGVQWPSEVLDQAIELDELSPTHARELFVRHAPKHAQASVELDEILAELGGIPLAIELLAKRAQALSLPVLRKTWATRRDRLLPAWVSAVAVVYESPLLSAAVGELLGVLAVVPGGVALADYDAVLGESWPDALDTAIGVAMAEDREGRLAMHGLVSEFVAREHPASDAGQARAREHYLAMARELGPKPGWPGGRAAAQQLAVELANVEAAILAGLARPDSVRPAIEAALALRYFGMFAGGAVGGVLEAARVGAEALGDPALSARCLQSLADIARERGQLDRAEPLLDQALAIHASLGSVLGQANCDWRLGDIESTRGQLDQAERRFERSLVRYESIANQLGQANCVKSLGAIALARGQLELASQRYQQAQPIFQALGAGRGHANCLMKSAEIAIARGELELARAHYQAARPIYERVGDVLGMAQCLVQLAELADEGERAQLHEQACAAWLSVDRADLVARLRG